MSNKLKEKNEKSNEEMENVEKSTSKETSTTVASDLKKNEERANSTSKSEKNVDKHNEKNTTKGTNETTLNDAKKNEAKSNEKKTLDIHERNIEKAIEKKSANITEKYVEKTNEKKAVNVNEKNVEKAIEKNAESDVEKAFVLVNNEKNKDKTKKQDAQKYNEYDIDGKKSRHKKSSHKVLLIILLLVIIILVITLSTIFGVMVSHSNQIASGVHAYGVDVSNLSQTQAIDKLNQELGDKLEREITLKHREYVTTVQAKNFGTSYQVENAVAKAYDIGRAGENIFVKNYDALNALVKKENIEPDILFDSNIFDETVAKINSELPDRLVNSSYKIEGTDLIIANSASGFKVQNDELKKSIVNALESNNNSTIEIPVEQYEAEKVDIDTIYKEIKKDPVDAKYSVNPYEIHKEENGLDFAISLDKARDIVSQNQESYTIPLKVILPNITVKKLPQEAFPDLLATYSTTYAASNYNRSSNIALAGKSIDGVVLMPGEVFSYNDTVGQRTPARGYKEAGVYVNGEVSTDYGGGICQVSSTLYNSVLLSNLEVVARTNHTFEPSYVPAGQDATVSWKSPDFQFKNNRSYPVRISSKAGGGRITVSIYGLKSDDDYEVKIQSMKTSIIPFTTSYQNDSSLPTGTTKVSQAGSDGCKTQTYQILYKNGEEISRKLINTDTYKPHNQVILRGTGAVADPVTEPDSGDGDSNI